MLDIVYQMYIHYKFYRMLYLIKTDFTSKQIY